MNDDSDTLYINSIWNRGSLRDIVEAGMKALEARHD